MNYHKIYSNLIHKRRNTPLARSQESDLHHVMPRSWGGTDETVNLVRLTTREHFIAHLLLVKLASTSTAKFKMLYAVKMMTPFSSRTSRAYALLQEKWRTEQLVHMNEVVGDNGETRRELTTRQSAKTMAETVVDGKSLFELRIEKISKHHVDVYEWEHQDGRHFTGTALELSRAHRGELIEPSKMTRNLNSPEYHRGWRSVEGGKKPSFLETQYSNVWTWKHRSGESFTGTSFELSKHVFPKQIMHPNRIERFAVKQARLDGWKPV